MEINDIERDSDREPQGLMGNELNLDSNDSNDSNDQTLEDVRNPSSRLSSSELSILALTMDDQTRSLSHKGTDCFVTVGDGGPYIYISLTVNGNNFSVNVKKEDGSVRGMQADLLKDFLVSLPLAQHRLG